MAWRDVWVGGLITAALFVIGQFLIALYLGKSGMASSYGAAGAVILLLVWFYCSGQVFFLGAEFTKRCTPAATARSRPRAQAA